MKRTKFIMLALVIALVLMGAGYAAWTQTFTINSTVNTGELLVQVLKVGTDTFEVTNVDGGGGYSIVSDPSVGGHVAYSVTTNPNDINSANPGRSTLLSLTSDISNMFPGSRITSTITFKNIGSIKTKVSSSYTDQTWTNLRVKVIKPGSTPADDITIGGGADGFCHSVQQVADAIVTAVGGTEKTLDTTDSLKTVKIVQELPHATTTDEVQNLSWSIDINFAQYNTN